MSKPWGGCYASQSPSNGHRIDEWSSQKWYKRMRLCFSPSTQLQKSAFDTTYHKIFAAMGNVWSLIQQTEKCPTICNTAPDPSKIDSGNSANIAGIGTFVLFFVSVGMTLLVSLINILR